MVSQVAQPLAYILSAGNFPGAPAPHFRVQELPAGGDDWTLYATYTSRAMAEECLSRLEHEGRVARLVNFAHCAGGALRRAWPRFCSLPR